jgi:hypothetical protein
MTPVNERIETEKRLAADVAHARHSVNVANAEIATITDDIALLQAKRGDWQARLEAAEENVAQCQAVLDRWRKEQTHESRLARAREAKVEAVRRAKELDGATEQDLIRAQEARIAAAEGLAAVLEGGLEP